MMCQKYILLFITAQLYHPHHHHIQRSCMMMVETSQQFGNTMNWSSFVLHFLSCEISMSFQWWNHHASSYLNLRVNTNVLRLKMRTIILLDGHGDDVYGMVVVSSCKYRPPLHRHLLAFCCSDTHQDWRYWTAWSHLFNGFFVKVLVLQRQFLRGKLGNILTGYGKSIS